MATFEIKGGHHYHKLPPLSTLPWVGKQQMQRYVTFDASCQYDSAPYNADDVNKLFGLSFGLRGVHWNSARFGWRWSNSGQCIELLAYVYCEGQRSQDEQLRFPVVAQVKLGERVACSIEVDHDPEFGAPIYRFLVTKDSLPFAIIKEINATDNLPNYGLTHGLYWGGATLCPHDMRVQIDRV